MNHKLIVTTVLTSIGLSCSAVFCADHTASAIAPFAKARQNADSSHEEKQSTNIAHEEASSGHVSAGVGSSATLTGSASFSAWERDFELGNRALDARLYKEAELRLNRALLQLNKTRNRAEQKALAHIGLAEANLALGNLSRARLLLEESRELCSTSFGAESLQMARLYADLAEFNIIEGKITAASDNANKSLKITEKAKDPRQLAIAQTLMARVMCKQQYYEDASEYLKKALQILEMQPGRDRLDYANALLYYGIVEKKLGDEQQSDEYMKRALALRGDAVSLDKTEDQRGLVKFDWIEGVYGSRQIQDPIYPLKYMVVDGVRVACTLVRSYKHLAVLISIANCSPQPVALSVGAVKLEKVAPGRGFMSFCDPGLIDETLEEDVIMDRTWRRRTLCHIEKSRKIPGYLKNGVLDVDDFFGNNTFGLYGAWDNGLRDEPAIVTREQFFYDEKPKSSDQELLGFMRGNGAARPTFIETGGARTGVVFFLRDRYDDAVVHIHIGNAELNFPFHTAPGQ